MLDAVGPEVQIDMENKYVRTTIFQKGHTASLSFGISWSGGRFGTFGLAIWIWIWIDNQQKTSVKEYHADEGVARRVRGLLPGASTQVGAGLIFSGHVRVDQSSDFFRERSDFFRTSIVERLSTGVVAPTAPSPHRHHGVLAPVVEWSRRPNSPIAPSMHGAYRLVYKIDSRWSIRKLWRIICII